MSGRGKTFGAHVRTPGRGTTNDDNNSNNYYYYYYYYYYYAPSDATRRHGLRRVGHRARHLSLILAFNSVGWAISSALKTEKYYDLCGSGAFAAVAVSTWASGEGFGVPRATWATCAVVAWAVRLGAFLVTRVHKDKRQDATFDGIKEDPKTFGIYWFVQGVWVLVTTMPVILINANAATQGPWRALDWIGFVIFAAGFTIETIADRQKKVIQSGREE